MTEIIGVLLAAGQSSRFGSNKLLHKLDNGNYIAQQSAKTLNEVFSNSIAIVNKNETKLSRIFSNCGLTSVVNEQYKFGISSSIACAMKNINNAQACVIALADMPFIKVETLKKIVGKMKNEKCIIAPCHKGKRGHPVLFSRHFFAELSQLNNDVGAKELIKNSEKHLTLIEVNDVGVIKDIDKLTDI